MSTGKIMIVQLKLNLGKTKNLLLSSWNASVPLCQWRGLKWVFSNATLLLCTDLSSPQWTNLSLSKDPSFHLLSGTLPTELDELSSLQSLYLSINSLSRTVPLELRYNSSLSNVNLGDNLLNGFRILRLLDFANNVFSGSIPEGLGGLNLKKLNLSYNNFSGVLPNLGESKFGEDVFEGNNPGLCGSPLRGCRGSSGMSSGAIAGIIIGFLTRTVVLASLLIGYVQGKKKKNMEDDEELEEEGEEDENGSSCSDGGDGRLILLQEKINAAVVVKRG
ncbi:transmembrane kinase-like 1 [Actinidia rufa]|uniref:Transmembrane kinase-like 1 n=1 Tax=Actinidia rufa TaxID=165716 RepID=A0A7J0H9P7_9ERIC|nr:transmembrane kinase-like 1 [Actinidia rufa]